MLETLRKYYYTVRHLRLPQITGRIRARLERYLGPTRLPDCPCGLQKRFPSDLSFPEKGKGGERDSIQAGRFSFLNTSRDLGRRVDWHPEAPLLWRFHLHSFQFLSRVDGAIGRQLCREWMESNPVGMWPAWHPYPTSIRVVYWCKSEIKSEDLLCSLYQQAAYLYRNLETHLLGNHLLENARALVFAGCFFGEQGEATKWLTQGMEIYRNQTPEQILDDGGHFERSPMYHALMLEGYVDVLNLLPEEHPDWHWLVQTVQDMSDFLLSVTHPGSRIALFNDATRNGACSTQELLGYAGRVLDVQPERRSRFDETGYYIHGAGNVYLIIDGGPIGPDYLPAHAHADIFSYELSIDGVLFIVDTGVYEYEAGDMRDYVRSTKAHNTVSVDGVDQAECWDSFRVARRYSPCKVSFEREGEQSIFEGTFGGYAHLIGDGIKHRRRIKGDYTQRRIAVTDRVTGEGRHTVESRIHLHPNVRVQRGRDEVLVEREGVGLRISTEDSRVRFEKGWYCPELGIRRRNTVVVLGGEQSLPTRLHYSIRY